MKKIILFTLLLVSHTLAFSQDSELIKSDFESIVKYTQNKQLEKVMDMTYPKMFDIVPKETMIAMANGALNSIGIDIVYEEVPVNMMVSPIAKTKDASIALGKYNLTMIIKFSNPQMIELFSAIGTQSFPGYEIEEVDPQTIRLKGSSYLLAIKDASTNNTWKYLNYDDQPFLNRILSEEVLTTARKLKDTL